MAALLVSQTAYLLVPLILCVAEATNSPLSHARPSPATHAPPPQHPATHAYWNADLFLYLYLQTDIPSTS